MNKVLQRTALLVATMLSALPAARAAEQYPSRTVRIIVPYPAGGPADLVGRITAEQLTTKLGQSFIVDNRPGAASLTGSDMVAKATPDGYTLLLGSIANTVAPAIYTHVSYDLKKDLVPVCRVMSVPNALLVPADSPYKTAKELIEAAKAQPGKLTLGNTGIGGSPHLTSVLFMNQAGIKMVAVPYKGTPPAQLDLLAGRLTAMFDNGSFPQVKAGKLRALAVSSAERSTAMPDVPTLAEQGFTGFAVRSWYGLFAPHDTPKPDLDVLEKIITEAGNNAGVKEKFANFGGETTVICGDKFQAYVDEQLKRWADVAQGANIKIDN